MDIRPIDDFYAVSEQITPEDVAEIKAAGFRSIVCHRPDDEEAGQATVYISRECKRKAAALIAAAQPVGAKRKPNSTAATYTLVAE